MATDLYSVLGVDRNASPAQIRRRFFELARTRHPDLFQGDEKSRAESSFQAITEAFNVLSNPERRRQHDLELARPSRTTVQGSDPKQLARVYSKRGARVFHEGRPAEATELFERATQIDPQHAAHWHSLAIAYEKVGRSPQKAMSAIAKACELDRINAKYLKVAGRLFAEGGMPRRAERYYREALRWTEEDDDEILAALDDL